MNNEKQNMKLINKHNKECKDSSLIDECLISHCFLRALEKQARQEIVKEMSLYFVKSNVEIYKQGNPAGCFYILRQGTCDIIVNGEKKEILQKGNYFGDTAILYGTTREHTVKTSTDCYVWIMEKKNFKKVIEHILHITYEDNKVNIDKMPLFSVLTQDQKNKLANNIFRETHFENKTIFGKGNVSNCIYILKDGNVSLKKDEKQIISLKKGDYCGVLEVITNNNRITEAVPKEKTHLLTLPVFWLKNLYGDNYRSALALALIKTAFNNDSNLKKLNLKFLDEIFNLISFKYYEKETCVIKAGLPKNSFIIVPIEGELVEGNTNQTICERNNVLFGKEIYDEDISKIDSEIKCKPNSLLAIIKFSDIKQHFGCSLKKLNWKFVEEIFNFISFKYYEKETEIIKQGEPKNALIVVPIEGELIEVSSSKSICPRNNVLFGKEIYDEDTSKTTSSINCKPYSLLAILKSSDLKQHFKCSLKMLGEKSSFIEQLRKVNLFKNFTNAKLENLSKKIKVEKVCKVA